MDEQDRASRSDDLHANADARRLEVDKLLRRLQAIVLTERCLGMAIALDPSVGRILVNCRTWRRASLPIRWCGPRWRLDPGDRLSTKHQLRDSAALASSSAPNAQEIDAKQRLKSAPSGWTYVYVFATTGPIHQALQ
jgi:hypothetical protein